VVVVGGGITGLAAAVRLVETDPSLQLRLIEAGSRLGGVLQTENRDGYLIERGADNFITNLPWGLELARRVGLEDDLLRTNPTRRRALVVARGRLQPVPDGFLLMQPQQCWPIVRSPILSLVGKLRLAAECLIPRRRESADESLASFVRRRLGREAFERLVQPLVGGIYTADPEKLSMAATLKRFQDMEREHGSLIRAALRRRPTARDGQSDSGARYSLFVAPRQGMSSLIDAAAQRLPAGAVQLGTRVDRIDRDVSGSWRLSLSDGTTQSCGGLILATPAGQAARLVEPIQARAAELLAGIPHASSAVVCLGYRRSDIAAPLEGFGFVVPAVENRQILAASFASLKFPGRAPDDAVLIRVFIGGALQQHLLERDDQQLIDISRSELAELIGAAGRPQLTEVVRWPRTMPQYHLGHLERIGELEQLVAAIPNLEIAGNAYHGVGIPQCIESGQRAAERLLATIQKAESKAQQV